MVVVEGAASLGEGRRHSPSRWRSTAAETASSGRGNGWGVPGEETSASSSWSPTWQVRFFAEFPKIHAFRRWSGAAEEEDKDNDDEDEDEEEGFEEGENESVGNHLMAFAFQPQNQNKVTNLSS